MLKRSRESSILSKFSPYPFPNYKDAFRDEKLKQVWIIEPIRKIWFLKSTYPKHTRPPDKRNIDSKHQYKRNHFFKIKTKLL